uniref:Uncharacterized protein n=1 Tax=Acyrthosiphon pisum TaxID=7029 RepID=C4WUP8_ACYPI|nr:hypothetical protein [Acyrthosiphon pisum]
MDKHIIMLALCLMVYIIGNIDAVENDKGDNNASSSKQRNDNEIVQDKNKRYSMFRRSLKDQFICLVHCYAHMYNNGLIKQKTNSQVTFEGILNTFYATNNISNNFLNENSKYEPDIDNACFKSEECFKKIKNNFTQVFVQLSKEELKTKLNALKSVNNSNYSELLTAFIQKYNPESNTECYKTVLAFCDKFSSNPNFISKY